MSTSPRAQTLLVNASITTVELESTIKQFEIAVLRENKQKMIELREQCHALLDAILDIKSEAGVELLISMRSQWDKK